MADINDFYDPTYSNDPSYIWDAPTATWVKRAASDTSGRQSTTLGIDGREQKIGQNWQSNYINPVDAAAKMNPMAQIAGGATTQPNASMTRVPPGSAAPPSDRYQIDPNSATQIDTQWRDQLKNFFGQLGEQKAPTIDQTQSNEMRGVQSDLIKRLQDQAAGVGPSLAQAQLQKASDQNLANTLSAIQATRGMGATAAGASAAGAGAAAGQQLAQDSAIVRLQEQMQAQGLLSNLASGTRGQDIGIAAQNAQMELQQQDSINRIRTQLIAEGNTYAEADRRARMQVLGMNQQGSMFSDQLYQQDRQFNRQQGHKETMAFLDFFKGLLQMGASAAGGALGAKGVTG